MPAERYFVQLDERIHDHPRILKAGPHGLAILLRLWCEANSRRLADGDITTYWDVRWLFRATLYEVDEGLALDDIEAGMKALLASGMVEQHGDRFILRQWREFTKKRYNRERQQRLRGNRPNEDDCHAVSQDVAACRNDSTDVVDRAEQSRAEQSREHTHTSSAPVGSADERPSVCVSDPPEQTQALVLAAASPKRSTPRVSDADVRTVLAHYRGYHPRMSAKLGKDSREYRLIVERMREGATVETCCRAIDGNHLSPMHCGENERGRKYHALTLIFRTASYVNDFAELADAGPQPVVSEQTRRQMRATETPFDIDAVLGPKRKTLEAPRDES
jgi:hypothetical protein